MYGTYVVSALKRFDEFERLALVGKIGGEKDFSVLYFYNLLPLRVHNRCFGEAAIVLNEHNKE